MEGLVEMNMLQNLDPNREPFGDAEAGMLAEFVLEYEGGRQEALELVLRCCYDQGVRDAVESIVTLEYIDQRNAEELVDFIEARIKH